MIKRRKKKMKEERDTKEAMTEVDADGATVTTEQLEKEPVQDSSEDRDREAAEGGQQELSALQDKYLRLLAEFENYKKRTFKEKLDTLSTAARDTMTALLPVIDDFDRAKAMADDETTNETFSEGVTLVYHKLKSTLEQKGLKAMETTGAAFDPEWHEALTEVPVEDDTQKGMIIDTVEKGYILNDKIIRHAKVVVGK